jgi:ComF family protein
MLLPRRWACAAIDFLFPVRCAMCAAIVTGGPGVCPACWGSLSFITSPFCERCGLAFEIAGFQGEVCCGACLARPPPFERARAALNYDDASRRLVLPFKHGDRPDIAATVAPWTAVAGADLLAGADWIVPIPLHRWRLLARRYNQSARLAARIADKAGVPVCWGSLTRRRRTTPQGKHSAAGRRRNVQGAFAVPDRYRRLVTGSWIVLVDDVMTTGATVEAATRAMLAAGASAVDVLTVARVPLASG